jgi:outer membrane protein assembly factor BamB
MVIIYYFLADNGELLNMSPTDGYSSMESTYVVKDFAADPSATAENNFGNVWAIIQSLDGKKDGYELLYWPFTLGTHQEITLHKEINPVQISVYNGQCYMVTQEGDILAINTDGGVGHWSTPAPDIVLKDGTKIKTKFATQISYCAAGMFALTPLPNEAQGGSVVKRHIWDKSGHDKWEVVEDIGALYICSAHY